MTTVLHVDDSHLARTLVRIALGKHGFDVIEAIDGQAGIEAAQRHAIDCVIVALDTPVVDGIKVIQRMRASGHHTPAILVAACPRRSTISRGLKAGASEVIERADLERSLPDLVGRLTARGGRAAA